MISSLSSVFGVQLWLQTAIVVLCHYPFDPFLFLARNPIDYN
jgi:hypothetical protein